MPIKILIHATAEQQLQWLQKPTHTAVEISFYTNEVLMADVYIDNDFALETSPFCHIKNKLVLVNAVDIDLALLPENYIVFNGWMTSIANNILECNYVNDTYIKQLQAIASEANWQLYLFNNVIGMASARVIAMIINEAYFALEANVSSKESIDIAMKLGTNYPFGPFEWSQKIGLKNIYHLLSTLNKTDARFMPCNLLQQEANV